MEREWRGALERARDEERLRENGWGDGDEREEKERELEYRQSLA